MSGALSMPMRRPLRSVRILSVPAHDGAVERGSRVRWLLDLRERAEREAAESVRRTEALERCVAGIESALEGLPAMVQERLAEIASIATELGLALAREVVGDLVDRELTDPTESVLRCLDSMTIGPADAPVRICLAPGDLAEVSNRLAENPALAARVPGAEFVVDERLEHGSARIETRTGSSEYDPIGTIDRVCAEVRKELAS